MSLVSCNVKVSHFVATQKKRIQFFDRPLSVGHAAPWSPPPPSDGSPVIYIDEFGVPIYSELPSWAITPEGNVDFDALEAGPPAFPPIVSDPATIKLVSGTLADHLEKMDLAAAAARRAASISASMSRSRAAIYNLGQNNEFAYFVTLTFYEPGSKFTPEDYTGDPRDYDSCCSMLLKFTRRLRNTCPGIKYLFLFELHPSGHGYHVHGLLSDHPSLSPFISPAYTPDGRPVINKGRPVFNFSLWNFGSITDIVRIDNQSRTVSYMCKYITKDLVEAVPKGRKRYWASRTCSFPIIEYGIMDPELVPTVLNSAEFEKEVKSLWRPHLLAELLASSYNDIISPYDMSEQPSELIEKLSEIASPENVRAVTGLVYCGTVPFYVLFSKNKN